MKQTGYICKRKVFRSYRGQKTLSRLYRSSLFFLTIPILLALTLSTKCGSEFKILLDDDNISPALYWSETGGDNKKGLA